MAVEKKNSILYVDGLGREHPALVTAVNQRGDYCPVCQSNERAVKHIVGGEECRDKYHEGTAPLEHYVTLVYIDEHRAESDNVVKVFDVKHISMLERETSPGLPSFHVNCWKYEDETHEALPADHPTFDHPFKTPEYDQDGHPIPTGRPKFAGAIADHQGTLLSMSAGTMTPTPPDQPGDPNMGELVGYGSRPSDQPNPMPSAADLDKVAEEEKAVEATTKKNGKVKPIASGK